MQRGVFGHEEQGDMRAGLALAMRSLTNSFNSVYTTPLSLFLPPNNGQMGVIRDKLKIQKIKVFETTATTIVVEEIQNFNLVVQPKQWTFTFRNNEWVCGSAVLFF